MDSITQDMKYRYSLMKYVEMHGVSQASRKYNKGRSYIYFWKARCDGSIESLARLSRKPHSHPNQHTEQELKLIRDMRRRNPKLGVVELWARMRQRGYSRCIESLWRVMRWEGLTTKEEPKKKYTPKPYEQMRVLGSMRRRHQCGTILRYRKRVYTSCRTALGTEQPHDGKGARKHWSSRRAALL